MTCVNRAKLNERQLKSTILPVKIKGKIQRKKIPTVCEHDEQLRIVIYQIIILL